MFMSIADIVKEKIEEMIYDEAKDIIHELSAEEIMSYCGSCLSSYRSEIKEKIMEAVSEEMDTIIEEAIDEYDFDNLIY